jgi:hypothetical protein
MLRVTLTVPARRLCEAKDRCVRDNEKTTSMAGWEVLKTAVWIARLAARRVAATRTSFGYHARRAADPANLCRLLSFIMQSHA